MRFRRSSAVVLIAAVGTWLGAPPARANVYPAQFSLTTPAGPMTCGTFKLTYYLNEDADGTSTHPGVTIEVLEQPSNTVVRTVVIPRQPRGQHAFEWDGRDDSGVRVSDGSTYKIRVTAADDGHTEWTQVSIDGTATSFYWPLGLSVNRHEWSKNYGKVYVTNATASVSSPSVTNFGRSTQDGIYVLNADGSESQFSDAGRNWFGNGNNLTLKSTIGPDDHLYVAEFNNDEIYELSADLLGHVLVVGSANRTSGQWIEGVWVEGTQADQNRVIYAVDSRVGDQRRGLIRYGLGGAAAATGTGTQYIGPDYFAFYPRDVARDAQGNWYMNQHRSSTGQAPAVTKFADSANLPINTAAWELDVNNPAYTGAWSVDVLDERGWVGYANNLNGEFLIFNTANGALVHRFDAGTSLREIAFDNAGNVYTADLGAQWLRVWSPPDGANSRSTTTASAIQVNNGLGGPTITAAPVSASFCPGNPSAAFSVTATGAGLTYRWKLEGEDLTDGAKPDGLTVTGAATNALALGSIPTSYKDKTITVAVCDANGVVVTNPVQLRLGATVVESPAPQRVCVGGTAAYSVVASGIGELHYQWQKDLNGDGNFTDIIDGTSNTILVGEAAIDQSGTQYRVKVTDDCTSVTSAAAVLTVSEGPAITSVGPDGAVAKGGTLALTATVEGTGELHYQWKRDVGGTLTDVGTDSSSYQVDSVTCDVAGSYLVEVTDACGTALSSGDEGTAVVTVTSPDVEACQNELDDDCDGLTDCDDPDCGQAFECQVCNIPWADAGSSTAFGVHNGDGDVDQSDFAMFQRCFSGADNPFLTEGENAYCQCFDRDNGGAGDGDVDLDDYGAFMKCMSGPGILWTATVDCP